MFLQYIDFVFVPFRAAYNKFLAVKNVKGNFKADINRMKSMKDRSVGMAKEASGAVGKAGAKVGVVSQAAGKLGSAQMPNSPDGPSPGIVTRGVLFKKNFCAVCGNQLDKTWDSCPFCAQAAAANKPKAVLKTQAFSVDSTGRIGQNQMCGWLVPLQGNNRGELFTLSPMSLIGNDPACTVVLADKFMSGKHAEVKVEAGVWVLKDLGSTNGTHVNNKRVEKHELVDNDVIKFGSVLVKFKCI